MRTGLIKYGGAVTGLGEIWAILKSVIKSTFSRNWQAGEEAKLFEKELADYLGVNHAILTTSGSCAGLLALSALELPKGSEVIIPAVTFPTIFNIILQCGLVPVIVDSKIGTYGLDVEEIEAAISPKTKAIIPVHALGNPVQMPELMKIAEKHNLIVIEDNCDGLSSTIGDKKVGSFGQLSITSLHAAHIVSMGVGGVVFTNDDELAKKVRMYRDWGRQADINKSENLDHPELPTDYNPRFIYEKIGYNFQILDLQAAMGRVQLRKINKIKEKRALNYKRLLYGLADLPLFLPLTYPKTDVCWFSFPLTTFNRGLLLPYLEKHGIETRPMFSGNIIKHPAYSHLKEGVDYRIAGNLDSADKIMTDSFWISCHPALSEKDVNYIIKTFHDFFATGYANSPNE